MFPNLGDGVSIEPLIGARIAHIVEVVVNSRAAAALSFIRGRQPANISPVIVAPEQSYVIRNAHAFLVVTLHLLVQCPNLGIGSDCGSHDGGR